MALKHKPRRVSSSSSDSDSSSDSYSDSSDSSSDSYTRPRGAPFPAIIPAAPAVQAVCGNAQLEDGEECEIYEFEEPGTQAGNCRRRMTV